MIQEEIRDMYSVAINCSLAAVVLAMASFGLHIRDNMGSAMNNQTRLEADCREYVRYDGYNGAGFDGKDPLNIDQVITLARNYAGTGVDIVIYFTNDISHSLNETQAEAEAKRLRINDESIRMKPEIETIDYIKAKLGGNDIDRYNCFVVKNAENPLDRAPQIGKDIADGVYDGMQTGNPEPLYSIEPSGTVTSIILMKR